MSTRPNDFESNGTPETSLFEDFDFDAYNAELEEVDIKQAAHAALDAILTLKQDDGTEKTREQIFQESEAFFSNPEIMQNLALLDSLAMQFAAWCNHHDGPEQSDGIRNDTVSSIFEYGQSLLEANHSNGNGGSSKKNSKAVRAFLSHHEVRQAFLRLYNSGVLLFLKPNKN